MGVGKLCAWYGTALAEEDVDEADSTPVSRETRMGCADFPEKNSDAVRAGVDDGAGGKMSCWNESAFLGTIKAIGSMFDPVSLYARAISHSVVLSARRGRNAIPRWGSVDLYSERS